MKINKEKLISLLAERTDMDQSDVHRQFVELVGRIEQAESKENTLEIAGFGTFMAVHDRLEFVPADVLETEINNKYAGMKPIELIGAYKEPQGEEVPVAVPAENNDFDQKPQEPSTDDKSKEDAEQSVPVKESTDEKAEDSSVSEKVAEEVDKEKSDKAVTAQKADKKKLKMSADFEKSLAEDPLGKAILIIICIIVLATAGWLAYNAGWFGAEGASNDTETNNVDSEQTINRQRTTPVQKNNLSKAKTTAVEQQGEPVTNNEEVASPVDEGTPYGLYGALNTDLAQGYYTIVVHSLQTMQLAEEKKQELAEEDFRIKINEASVNGDTYYRVGVGQFTTVKEAQKAIRELPEPYKSNNFINRF